MTKPPAKERMSEEHFNRCANLILTWDSVAAEKLVAEARRARRAEEALREAERTLDRDLQMTAARLMACEDDIVGFHTEIAALKERVDCPQGCCHWDYAKRVEAECDRLRREIAALETVGCDECQGRARVALKRRSEEENR